MSGGTMSIVEVVADVVTSKINCPADQIRDLSDHTDSMGILDIIMEIERRTGLQFDGAGYGFESFDWRDIAQAFG
jgi:acyl carrier protein